MNTSIPYFQNLKDAQSYLDYIYNLPVWKLVKHYPYLRLVVDNTKQVQV